MRNIDLAVLLIYPFACLLALPFNLLYHGTYFIAKFTMSRTVYPNYLNLN